MALSLGLPRPGVTRHLRSVESGLSSKPWFRGHPAIRNAPHMCFEFTKQVARAAAAGEGLPEDTVRVAASQGMTMQGLEHVIRPLTHERDLGHVKRPWQLWKTFTDFSLCKETPRAGQLASKRHMKFANRTSSRESAAIPNNPEASDAMATSFPSLFEAQLCDQGSDNRDQTRHTGVGKASCDLGRKPSCQSGHERLVILRYGASRIRVEALAKGGQYGAFPRVHRVTERSGISDEFAAW